MKYMTRGIDCVSYRGLLLSLVDGGDIDTFSPRDGGDMSMKIATEDINDCVGNYVVPTTKRLFSAPRLTSPRLLPSRFSTLYALTPLPYFCFLRRGVGRGFFLSGRNPQPSASCNDGMWDGMEWNGMISIGRGGVGRNGLIYSRTRYYVTGRGLMRLYGIGRCTILSSAFCRPKEATCSLIKGSQGRTREI